MPRLTLDVHGVLVAVEAADLGDLAPLERDFAYFVSHPSDAAPAVRVRLHAGAPAPPAKPPLLWWRGPGWRAGDSAGTRLVAYDDGEMVLWNETKGVGDVHCPEPHRRHELAYLLILSRAGQRLDERGLHRVHALGFEWRGQGGLLLLPSGGGKTSIALELRRGGEAGFLSEDTPLVGEDGLLRAFPLRWGLRDPRQLSGIPAALVRPFARKRYGLKWLVDLEYFGAQVRDRVPLRWILLGRRSAGPARLSSAPRAAALAALARDLVVGFGVPQMSEYTLRLDAAPGLAGIARRRLAVALKLARLACCHRFELGQDACAAARALAAFLGAARAPSAS